MTDKDHPTVWGKWRLKYSDQAVRTRCLEAGRYTGLKVMTNRWPTDRIQIEAETVVVVTNFKHRQRTCWCFHWTFQNQNLSLKPSAQFLKRWERLFSNIQKAIKISFSMFDTKWFEKICRCLVSFTTPPGDQVNFQISLTGGSPIPPAQRNAVRQLFNNVPI